MNPIAHFIITFILTCCLTVSLEVGAVNDQQELLSRSIGKKDSGTSVLKIREANPSDINCSVENSTRCEKNFLDIMQDKDMLLRTLYVTLGVTGIVVVYFIIRAVRLRRKRTKTRKYGIITQQGDRGDMEMEPLGDGNEDDEDYTIYEVNGRKK